jgi:hypothetical protein
VQLDPGPPEVDITDAQRGRFAPPQTTNAE